MRPGDQYDCRRCQRRGAKLYVLCRPRCRHARDENGNAPALPARQTLDRALRGRGHGWLLVRALVRPVVAELSLAARQSRARRRLKARLREAGPATPIAEAKEGLVRVEGRVTVLDPATAAAGREHVGAFVWRTVVDIAADGMALRRITTQRGWGRFLIDDGTGVALVDDGFLDLRDFKGRETEPHEEGGIAVRDGTSITVLGRARRGAAELPTDALNSQGYRGRTLPLIFDGSSDEPLVIFAQPHER